MRDCIFITYAMMVIEHGGDPIKSEAIKAILLHPPAQV